MVKGKSLEIILVALLSLCVAIMVFFVVVVISLIFDHDSAIATGKVVRGNPQDFTIEWCQHRSKVSDRLVHTTFEIKHTGGRVVEVWKSESTVGKC